MSESVQESRQDPLRASRRDPQRDLQRRGFARFAPALIALLAVLTWLPAGQNAGFSFDDREVLFGNPVVEGQLPWTAAFDRDYWHHRGDAGHYRPLATLSLRLDRVLHDENAPGYRRTNVFLHAAVVYLLALFWRRRFGPRTPAAVWLGLVFFACHPLLADAVAWISGRTSMISALGGLLGLHLVLFAERFGERSKKRILTAGLGALTAVSLAMLGKEDGFVFGVLAVWLCVGNRRAFVSAGLGALLGLGLVLALRQEALGSALPSAPHAPLAAAGLLERMQTGGLSFLEGLRLAAFPWNYPPHYEASSLLDGVTSAAARSSLAFSAWIFLALCLVLPGLHFLRSLRSGRELLFQSTSQPLLGAFFLALSCLPLMQIVPAGEIFAPRWAYLPLFFAVPIFAAGSSLSQRKVLFAGALLLLSFVPLSRLRAQVYESRASFRHAVLKHRPHDAPSWNDLGVAHWEEGDARRASAAWRKAIALDGGYSRPHTNLGNAALQREAFDVALRHYRIAVQLGPKQPLAQLNLSNALRRSGALEKATRAAERAVQLAPGMGAAQRALGRAHLEAGRPEEAVAAFDLALELNPQDRIAEKLRRKAEAEMLGSPP